MRKKFIFTVLSLFILTLFANAAEIGCAYRIHNENGMRVGTCKKDGSLVYRLFDLNGKPVANPAAFLGQPENDCWLFDVDGLAIGKCSATRVIIWKSVK